MKSYWWSSLFLLMLLIIMSGFPIALCEEQSNSFHNNHLNDESDEFPNDYKPLVIPIGDDKQIMVAPIITCTTHENDTWHPNNHTCKLAQTFLVDADWSDGNANYTYIFEDWTDYDWNDIIVNLYASISSSVSANLLLTFREAVWKNPFGLEIAVEGTWIQIEWNSTEYPNMQSLMINDGAKVKVDLFAESNEGDKALLRFLIPPVASFSWQPPEPFVGDPVLFDASASYDFDKEIATYSWNFGDGTLVETESPMAVHSYTSSGIYTVNLTVIDTDGLADTALDYIGVLAIIGGETVSLSNTPITVWTNVNILLIIAFAALSVLRRRKSLSI